MQSMSVVLGRRHRLLHVRLLLTRCKAKLLKNLKCARRGAAAGPSGMTADHLKVVLENHRDSDLFHNICQLLVRAAVPREIFSAIRIGRLTALQKANGGIRGIVAVIY